MRNFFWWIAMAIIKSVFSLSIQPKPLLPQRKAGFLLIMQKRGSFEVVMQKPWPQHPDTLTDAPRESQHDCLRTANSKSINYLCIENWQIFNTFRELSPALQQAIAARKPCKINQECLVSGLKSCLILPPDAETKTQVCRQFISGTSNPLDSLLKACLL